MRKFQTLEEGITRLRHEAHQGPITVKKILQLLPGKGLALIIVFLSLPFCQPLQIPGFAIPFGLVVAFAGLRMAFGKKIWLPKRLLARKISDRFLQKTTKKILAFVKKMSRWIHPRLNSICHSPVMKIANGLTVFFLGIFLALPLPIPLSNLIAAWGILLFGIGILEDDGVLVLLGYAVTLLIIAFFVGTSLYFFHQ